MKNLPLLHFWRPRPEKRGTLSELTWVFWHSLALLTLSCSRRRVCIFFPQLLFVCGRKTRGFEKAVSREAEFLIDYVFKLWMKIPCSGDSSPSMTNSCSKRLPLTPIKLCFILFFCRVWVSRWTFSRECWFFFPLLPTFIINSSCSFEQQSHHLFHVAAELKEKWNKRRFSFIKVNLKEILTPLNKWLLIDWFDLHTVLW